MNNKIKVLYMANFIPQVVNNNIILRSQEDVVLKPNERAIIKTGLKVAIPQGFEMLINRVGSIDGYYSIVNEPGTIDSDYRGEIGVIVRNNNNKKTITIKKGESVAQGIITKISKVKILEADENMNDLNAVYIKALKGSKLPSYATTGAAGVDIEAGESLVIEPNSSNSVKINFNIIKLPENVSVTCRSRSGLAIKNGISANSNIIYHNNSCNSNDFFSSIYLTNYSNEQFKIEQGDRIAQLVFKPRKFEISLLPIELQKVVSLNVTSRGEGGFGSTGIKRK